MMGMGKAMMQRLMKDINFPQVDELIKLAKELDVKFIACTTTIGMMGITKDAFIPEVDSFAGVATYIAEASKSKISLFI